MGQCGRILTFILIDDTAIPNLGHDGLSMVKAKVFPSGYLTQAIRCRELILT